MKYSHVKVLLVTLTEKVQELEKEIRIKEWTINNLQRKLKAYEEREHDV